MAAEVKSTVVGQVKQTVSGWFKAALVGLGGLVSGAVMMYVSPLVERVVKPAKPLANFAHEVKGLQVTFQDRSQASDGWWDFGDGSALEPYVPGQASITHTYPRPGSYTAKLVVRNFLGQESERAVNIQLEGSKPGGVSIDAFEVQPLQPESYAPATFRITARVNHAEQCIWACGSEQPIEVVFDPAVNAERYVTFKRPGFHMVRLAALQGRNVVQKQALVKVASPPANMVMAVLNVTHEAVRIEKTKQPRNLKIVFPEQSKDTVYKFHEEIKAWTNSTILKAEFATKSDSPWIKNAKVIISPEKTKAIVSGELHKPATPPREGPALPAWSVEVVLHLERHHPPQRLSDAMAVRLALPGTTVVKIPALQPGWMSKQRQLDLNLMEGDQSMWQSAGLPRNALVRLQGRLWRITATEAGDQLRIEATQASMLPALSPVGN